MRFKENSKRTLSISVDGRTDAIDHQYAGCLDIAPITISIQNTAAPSTILLPAPQAGSSPFSRTDYVAAKRHMQAASWNLKALSNVTVVPSFYVKFFMRLNLLFATALSSSLLASVGALAQNVLPDETPGPKIEGQGDQTQKAGLLQDQVTVTVESNGNVEAAPRDENLNAEGEVQIDVQTPGGETDNSGDIKVNAQSGEQDAQAAIDTEADNASHVEAAETPAPSPLAAIAQAQGDCVSRRPSNTRMSPDQLSNLSEGAKVFILIHCSATTQPSSDQLEAVHANPYLTSLMSRMGVADDNIVALTIAGNGNLRLNLAQ